MRRIQNKVGGKGGQLMILNNNHRERRELLFRIIKGELEKFKRENKTVSH